MSFLLLEEEEQATLAEALAFIDTFPAEAQVVVDDDATTTNDHSLYVELRLSPNSPEVFVATSPAARSKTTAFAHGSPLCGSTSGTDSSGGDPEDDEQQQKKLRARAANTRAVHRYRKRNKNEIIALREQVQQLEAQLAQLRSRNASAHKVPKHAFAGAPRLQQLQASFTSMGDAAIEYRKLQASEALNRQLKEALEKQRKVNATLEDIFKKQIQKTDLNLILDVEKKLTPNASDKEVYEGWDNARMFTNLFHYLHDELYMHTSAALERFSRCDVDAVFNNTQYKHDPKVGKTYEFMSNTPLACSMEQLDAKLWTFLTLPVNSSDEYSPQDPFFNVYKEGDITTQRVFTMSFDSLLGNTRVDGVSAIRKFVEPHRIVLTFSSLLSPNGSGLLFRENAWLILSDAHVSGCSSAPTLFQTLYRLQADHETPTKTMAPEVAKVYDMVLSMQGEKMRAYQVLIQNRLLNRFDEIPDGGILPSCIDLVSCCG